MADWSSLHSDILLQIIKKINIYEDYVSFGAVCTSWRSVATKGKFNESPGGQFPWLMLSQKSFTNICRFFSLWSGRILELRLSAEWVAPNARFASKGWLFIKENRSTLRLYHTLSGAEMLLPHTKRSNWLTTDAYINVDSISKALLSCSPSKSSDFMVMFISNCRKKSLTYFRYRDEEWSETNFQDHFYFEDIAYSNGKFYALDNSLRVFLLEIDDSRRRRIIRPHVISRSIRDMFQLYRGGLVFKSYLVESSATAAAGGGKLIIVTWEGAQMVDNRCKYSPRIGVFEVGSDGDDEQYCREVKNLGNQSLFLSSRSSSFSLEVASSSSYCGVCKPNCIYFLEDNSFSPRAKMAVYNILDQTFELFFNNGDDVFASSALWIQPSMS